MKIRCFDENKKMDVVAGDLANGKLTKHVIKRIHFLRIVDGYAISLEAISKITGLCNVIVIKEKDTKQTYHILFSDFEEHRGKWNHGHGPQYTISMKYLKKGEYNV